MVPGKGSEKESFGSLVRTGFGVSLGAFAVRIIFILLGLAFFIPGLIMVRRNSSGGDEQEDPDPDGGEKKRSNGKIIGYVLMAVGVVVGGGLGFGFLVTSLFNENWE